MAYGKWIIAGLCGLIVMTVQPAQAQDAAQNTDKAEDEAPTVTVKGKKSINRTDRQVYDVTKDPDHETATADETLRKLPGVAVDGDGKVTIRGNEAKVMVNGRPWLMYVGDNRAAALRAMPSSMIA